jgi:pimeloyl-ACP methyl ester carboxylesterase
MKNVVLVHGGFVDGSGWGAVYKILARNGYSVTVVQNPTISLEGDVAYTRRALAAQDGPAILVGHSYGGAVITEAGNDPKVAGLVYIAAFALDKGESVATLIDPAPGAPAPPIMAAPDGFLFLDKAQFHASFAADVDPEKAAFIADSQKPWGAAALIFGFLGVTDATFLTAGGTMALNRGQDRDAFLAPHLQAVQTHAQTI